MPLAITNTSITADYAIQTNTCGATVNAGASCAIGVVFTPTGTGTVNGSLIITHDASDGLNVVRLTGYGVGAFAQLSASNLSFAPQAVRSTSAAQVVQLGNVGNRAMTISSISPSGDFTVTHNCPASLAAGASCALDVSFAPTASGDRTGEIVITDNAYGNPHRITLSGTGTSFALVVLPGNPTSLTVPAGQTRDRPGTRR